MRSTVPVIVFGLVAAALMVSGQGPAAGPAPAPQAPSKAAPRPTAVTPRGNCVVKCTVLYGDNRTQCAADSRCVFSTMQSRCIDRCDLLGAKLLCESRAHCEYNVGADRCERKCDTYPAVADECESSNSTTTNATFTTNCLVRGTKCVPKCDYGSRNACLGKYGCSWNSTTSTCVPGCNIIYGTDKSQCTGNPGCVWLVALGACADRCKDGATSEDRCTGTVSLSHCRWAGDRCTEACEWKYLNSTVDCALDGDCQVYNNNISYPCQNNCSRLGLDSEKCKNNTQCNYDDSNKVCVRACGSATNQGQCTDSHCQWSNLLGCVQKCGVDKNIFSGDQAREICRRRPQCYFDAAKFECKVRCAVQYYSLAVDTYLSSCTADASCEVINGDVCREKCDTLDQLQCWRDGYCYYNTNESAKGCRKRCGNTLSESACNDQSGCEWFASRNVCRERCELFNGNATECISNTQHCIWLGANQSCTASCDLRSTDCSSNECIALNGQCGVKCSRLNRTQCTDSGRCAWNDATGKCSESCAARFGRDKAGCAGASDCEFLDLVGCRENCTTMASRTACGNQSHCWYDGFSEQCRAQCVLRSTSATGCASFCQAVGPICTTKCADLNASAACTEARDCLWRGDKRECVLRCASRYQGNNVTANRENCNNDQGCEWNADADRCTERCGVAADANECGLIDGCMWANTTRNASDPNATVWRCVQPCERRSTTRFCGETNSCEWFEDARRCYTACEQRANNAADCGRLFPRCQWAGGRCAGRCNLKYTNDTACGLDNRCERGSASLGSTCLQRCDGLSSQECALNSHCFFSKSGTMIDNGYDGYGRCRSRCNQRTATDCAVDGLCAVLNGTCAMRCGQFTDATNCQLTDQTCFWDVNQRVCLNACHLRFWDQNATIFKNNCNADRACEYVSSTTNKCERACSTFVYSATQTPLFSLSFCSGRCDSSGYTSLQIQSTPTNLYACAFMCSAGSYTQSQCEGYGQSCTFNSTLGGCTENCTLYTEEYCPSATTSARCQFTLKQGSTTDFACAPACWLRASTQANCELETGCEWVSGMSSNKCRPKCSSFPVEKCGSLQTSHCSWNSKTGKCDVSCAAKYGTDGVACNGDERCQWLGSQCYVRCSTITSNVTCGNVTECFWGPRSSSCKPKCTLFSRDNTYSSNTTLREEYVMGNCSASDCEYTSSGAPTVCVQGCGQLDRPRCVQSSPTDYASYCFWSLKTQTCRFRCEKKWSSSTQSNATIREQKCRADAVCQWRPNTFTPSCTDSCVEVPLGNANDGETCPNSLNCIPTLDGGCEFDCRERVTKTGSSSTQATECGTQSQVCQFRNFRCELQCPYLTATSCSNDPNCFLNGTRCQQGCPFYTTESACNASGVPCQWARTGSFSYSCVRSCASYRSDAGACRQAGHCRFLFARGVCSTRCAAYQNPSNDTFQGGCQADSACTWRSSEGKCYDRCGVLDIVTCQNAASQNCVWNARYGQCVGRCNFRYQSSTSCNADAGCEWVQAAFQCAERCSAQPPENCGGHCAYSEVSRLCKLRCQYLFYNSTFSVSDPYVTNCNASSECVAYGTTCYDNCKIFGRSTCGRVSAASHCAFNDVLGRCVARCSTRWTNPLTYNTTCGVDAECQLGKTSSATVFTCDQKCDAFQSIGTCNAVGNCLWYETLNRCATRCSSRHGTNLTTCAADGDCVATDTQCIERCDYQLTQAPCEAVSSCVFKNGVCQSSCNSRFDNTVKSCLSAAGVANNCSLASGSCQDRCSVFETEERCTAPGTGRASRCNWINGTGCRPNNCNDFSSAEACSNEGYYCWYDLGASSCRRRCEVFNSSSNCTGSTGCTWLEKPGVCVIPCGMARTTGIDRAGCLNDYYCEWTPGSRSCTTRCLHLAFSSCVSTSACRWDTDNQRCFRDCNAYHGSNRTSCDLDDNCNWIFGKTPADTKCQNRCGFFNTTTLCALAPGCEWYARSATCERRCQFQGAGSREACNANPRCQWTNRTNSCERRCDESSSYAQCIGATSSTQCDWAAPNNTVKVSVRTSRANLTSLKDTFAGAFGVKTDNVTVVAVKGECNSSIVDVTVAGDYATVQAAIETSSSYSANAKTLSSDVSEVAEQGTIASIASSTPSDAPTSSAASVALTALFSAVVAALAMA